MSAGASFPTTGAAALGSARTTIGTAATKEMSVGSSTGWPNDDRTTATMTSGIDMRSEAIVAPPERLETRPSFRHSRPARFTSLGTLVANSLQKQTARQKCTGL